MYLVWCYYDDLLCWTILVIDSQFIFEAHYLLISSSSAIEDVELVDRMLNLILLFISSSKWFLPNCIICISYRQGKRIVEQLQERLRVCSKPFLSSTISCHLLLSKGRGREWHCYIRYQVESRLELWKRISIGPLESCLCYRGIISTY